MYFMPASFASCTHASASNFTGLNCLASCSYSLTGIGRAVHDPLADAGDPLALPLAGRDRVEAPVDCDRTGLVAEVESVTARAHSASEILIMRSLPCAAAPLRNEPRHVCTLRDVDTDVGVGQLGGVDLVELLAQRTRGAGRSSPPRWNRPSAAPSLPRRSVLVQRGGAAGELHLADVAQESSAPVGRG